MTFRGPVFNIALGRAIHGAKPDYMPSVRHDLQSGSCGPVLSIMRWKEGRMTLKTRLIPVHVTAETFWKMKTLSKESGLSVSSMMREMAENFCDDVGVAWKS